MNPNKKTKPRAATQDILGETVIQNIHGRWKKQYRRLAELRDLFRAKRETMSKDATEDLPNFSMHMANAGTDAYDRDWALSMLSSEQNALYEIEQAMNRIIENTYGICEITGQPIAPERLEAIPWTRFSAEAERQLEKEGKVEMTKLGGRHSAFEPEPPPEKEAE